MARVLGEHARAVRGRRRLVSSRPLPNLIVRQLHPKLARRDVELDDVAVPDGGNRAAVKCLRGHVARHQPVCGT